MIGDMVRGVGFIVGLLVLAGCAPVPAPPDVGELAREVEATERAFAATMAQRDHDAFRSFLADDVIFFAGSVPIRGANRVADAWRRFYEGETAPFSWEPDVVEVIDSGTLALTSGPVVSAGGATIGTFTSIWRHEAPGVWRIVFDKGCDVCP